MAAVKFLFDENVPEALADALIRQEPAIEIVCVGDETAPAKGTRDLDLLKAVEAGKWALLTLDKRTMVVHANDHLALGNHTWGVFILRQGLSVSRYVEALVEIWACSQAEEWQDRIEWLP